MSIDIRQFVLDKITKKVLRHGYSDFENDGSFNTETEELLEKDFCPCVSIRLQDIFYNTSTEEFQETQP